MCNIPKLHKNKIYYYSINMSLDKKKEIEKLENIIMILEEDLKALQLKEVKLKTENTALKTKITLIYENWTYDYKRFQQLKDLCKSCTL